MKRKMFKIIFMDGFDTVCDLETGSVIFSTKLDSNLCEDTGRTHINENVIDNVVNIWNEYSIYKLLRVMSIVDNYLLDESQCTQEEREIIVESLLEYANIEQ